MGGQLTALAWEWLLEAPTFQTAAVQMPLQPARLIQPADLIPSSLQCSPPNCLPRRLKPQQCSP